MPSLIDGLWLARIIMAEAGAAPSFRAVQSPRVAQSAQSLLFAVADIFLELRVRAIVILFPEDRLCSRRHVEMTESTGLLRLTSS